MPKRKANWWPSSILSDPDVLSVDDEGRFVLCKICHVHYAVHGGKKPKPVIMNSNFRTRAWDVHKERTNSHRLQKQQERLQQVKTQQQQPQGEQAPDTQAQGQQQTQSIQAQQQQLQSSQRQTETQSGPGGKVLTQVLPCEIQGQGQTPAPLTQASLRSQSKTQVQQQQQQQHLELEETKDTTGEQLQTRKSRSEGPTGSVGPETITTVNEQDSGVTSGIGKRLAQSIPAGAPMQRRRIFRAGSPRSSMHPLAESETIRRPNAHAYERHSFMAVSAGNHTKRVGPSDDAVAMEQQADSSARWRHMHDDVSRALSAGPRRRQQGSSSYTSGELRAAKTLAQTETGDLGSNNSERVAKKLRSLNAEFHASNMRLGDAYNMRHTDVFDRRSAGYKEYWGTLRDVYTSSGTTSGSVPGNSTTYRKSHHRSNPSARLQRESKETEADSTTPDDSGSSEDAFKPAVVVHDASLFSAIERLTEATSKQIANLYQEEAANTRDALVGLTTVMTDLRVQHGNAFNRIIELQEKHLKTMQDILEIKLRKEVARNAKSSSNNNENTSSGSNPGDSTNGIEVTSDIAEG